MTPLQIQWRDAEPDVRVQDLDALLVQVHWMDALAFIRNALAGLMIYFTKEAEHTIETHLGTEPYELGGLLLGKVFRVPFAISGEYAWITLVEKSLPSTEYRNSSVSLRMGTEVWNRAGTLLQSGLMVVGWYHSHPNLGVFFSGIDRATQSAFFNHPYALGLVVDPIKKERKCFFGGASEELESRAMAIV